MADNDNTDEINAIVYRKYQDVILKEFASNRKRSFNPNALFFYAFTEKQANTAELYVREVFKRHARPYIVVDCSGKRYREIIGEVIDQNIGRTPGYELYEQFEAKMRLGSGASFVFKMPSQIKGETKEGRIFIARELMKILDDAHLDGINTMSDVILIDHASFLESGWNYLSLYATVVGPIETSFEDWFPGANDGHPRIWPVEG